jgi:hypothetical protein
MVQQLTSSGTHLRRRKSLYNKGLRHSGQLGNRTHFILSLHRYIAATVAQHRRSETFHVPMPTYYLEWSFSQMLRRFHYTVSVGNFSVFMQCRCFYWFPTMYTILRYL